MAEVEKQSLLDRTLGGFGLVRTRTVSPTSTVGAMGTSVFGGYVQENEVNAKLAGREKYRTFSNILANTSIVAAGTRYFLNVIGRAQWRVEVADVESESDQAEAERLAELIEDMMHDMVTPWKRAIRRASMYRFYGFSVQEWTAKRRDDGVFGFLDVAPRPQITIERWDLDVTGSVLGMIQRSPQNSQEIFLPRSKVVYIVDDALNDSPEGLGLFRSVVEPSERLSRYEQLEGFGFETDLRGIPVGRIPYAKLKQDVDNGRLTAEEAQKAIDAMETFVRKHIKNPQLGITMDSIPYESTGDNPTPTAQLQWAIDLLSGDGGNFESVGNAIERLNHEMARVLGVEHLLLGQSRGTQALSQDKSDNFGMIVDSTLDEIREVYGIDWVGRIFELNGWDKKFMPTLKTSKIQFRDVQTITMSLKDMANAGAILDPNDPAIAEVRDELGLSRPIEVIADNVEDAAIPGNLPPNDTSSEGDE